MGESANQLYWSLQVVFLDRHDRKMILQRSTGRCLSLAQCGIDIHRRMTFYDQVSGCSDRLRLDQGPPLTSSLVVAGAHDGHGHQAGSQRAGGRDHRQGGG
jgi:hypothetical protein